MAFAEDRSVFLADFGVFAEVREIRKKVILDVVDASVLGDRVQSTGYTIHFQSTDFPELSHGDWVTIESAQYEVVTVSAIDDGKFKIATLQLANTRA